MKLSKMSKMKKLLILSFALLLSACGSNDDGSSKSTYSSCKIISSEALFASDRNNDLSQCWNASGNGYESQGDALQWCEQQVNAYIADTYIFGHTVTYAVESTYCP
jgi:hypothetical protein